MTELDLIHFIDKKGDVLFDKKVIAWIQSSAENQAFYNQVKAKHVIATLDVSSEKIDPAVPFNVFKKHTKSKNKTIRLFLQRAAVLLLPLALVTYFYFSSKNDVHATKRYSYTTKAKEQRKVTLADGTFVWLNAESKIVFSDTYNESERRIKLYGEAFFDVTKNKQKPFIVETESGIDIKVLGTSFNIKSYADEKRLETTLVTGKIELKNKEAVLSTLLPKQQAVFFKSEKALSINTVNTSNFTSWKSGTLLFNETPLKEVVLSLERWFGVKVNIASKEFYNYSFSGKIEKTNSIEEIMRILEVSSNVTCEFDKKTNQMTIR
ncbi:FecR family protein [Flavobacterium sp. TAB 87]|uniref:FecR family protein n=1 Tax=Flavobacterium sp. TAB 87 TaxID=1729581 RepID=UPI00076DBF22|nr:FecR family protein [Flavobacterium sp. TAB 87]KVV13701.1 fec operon regulator FecR [Flavobacterium sp. TAB 87]